MKSYKNKALKENYKEFSSWLHSGLSGISNELLSEIDLCAEEIYSNTVFYAYPELPGIIETVLIETEAEIILKFTDEGIPYNPLEKPDPDISLPVEQRPVGGLGIYIVKQLSDEIFYERKNQKNILTLKFKL